MVSAEKVILAFSGGLDTSYCVVKLKEEGYRVITVLVDTGGFDEPQRRRLAQKARHLGADKHVTVHAEDELYDGVISPLIRSNGVYQGVYPQMCADRYLIVEKCIEVARREKTNKIAHGCTAMGNDQVRFDVSIRALGDYEILAPIRDLQASVKRNVRDYEIRYLKERGFEMPAAHRRYTMNQNVLGITISGSEIDRFEEPDEAAFTLTCVEGAAERKAGYFRVGFSRGLPVSLNGKRMKGVEILKRLNHSVGRYGCGRFIYTGDTILGIKGRIAFECPGLYALLTAHRALEETVLSKEQNQFKEVVSRKWAYLVYAGLYFDPLRRDLERFLESHQRWVSGEVTLKVLGRNLTAVATRSDSILREKGTEYAQSASWRPEEAEGFVKLFGLGSTMAGRRGVK